MKRILFVDDEPRVLDGLKSLLWRRRREWEMVFAAGGRPALEHMSQQPFDVIVTDMRMPGMDGAELLSRVRDLHPRTVRIVLSGQTEQAVAQRLIHTAHQFLSKPCDGTVLQEVIERSCGLNEIIHDEGLREAIGKIGQLPAYPASLAELNRILADPESSIRDVASVVESDPGFCAKVLQIVNSAFFGLAQRITQVDAAVSYLGMDLLRSLAMMLQVYEDASGVAQVRGYTVEEIQEHSLLVGRIAHEIAADLPCRQDAFVSGMIHEVGRLILAARVPDRLRELSGDARIPGPEDCDAEREVLGVSHAEIGAYLLGAWGVPFPLVEAVHFHRAPSRVALGRFDLVGVVHVADALAVAARTDALGARSGVLDTAWVESASLCDRVAAWRETAARVVAGTQVC